jgi:RNA polymerase sigma factor (sigma-70 family)
MAPERNLGPEGEDPEATGPDHATFFEDIDDLCRIAWGKGPSNPGACGREDLAQAVITDFLKRGLLDWLASTWKMDRWLDEQSKDARDEINQTICRHRDRFFRPHRLQPPTTDPVEPGRKKAPRISPKAVQLDLDFLPPKLVASGDSDREWVEFLDSIEKLMERLSETDKKVLRLFVIEQLGRSEVADAAEVSPSRVRKIIIRFGDRVRQYIRDTTVSR